MKSKVLLLDESLTVQKVVALTLDRNRYTIAYAKTRAEVMKAVMENAPDIILVSDQVSDLNISVFPKEVESWSGRDRRCPPLVLITNQDIKEMRHYQAVLRKPFSPQALQAVVQQFAQRQEETRTTPGIDLADDDHRLQKMFNDSFSDEQRLMRETLAHEEEKEERTLLTIPAPPPTPSKGHRPPVPMPKPQTPESVAELWGGMPSAAPPDLPAPEARPRASTELMGAADSMAYKATLESQIESFLRSQNLEKMVHTALENLIPSIVERLAKEKLDQLLNDQQSYVELKP